MRILHVGTNSSQDSSWFEDHFNFLCQSLGHTGETRIIPDYGLTAEKADIWWRLGAEYFNSFDAVYVSHLASTARVFLQNGWKKPLYIWLFFRFDYFDPMNLKDQAVYHQQMRAAYSLPNVKFFAATEYDRGHTQRVIGDVPIELVEPLVYINNAEKKSVNIGPDKFYVMNKHNETMFMNLKATLDGMGVPTYTHSWLSGPPDLRGIKGIIHIPYYNTSRSLLENLAIENVYFLPSLQFFQQLRNQPNFFWDIPGARPNEDAPNTIWYKPENQKMFVYFDSFEQLRDIVKSPRLDDLIAEKKQAVREFTVRHNTLNLERWGRIFS